MKLAAIDIGSNASRLLIKKVDTELRQTYNSSVRPKLDYMARIPVQLGMDVYASGYISQERTEALAQAMKQFRLIMIASKVKHWRACATASLRDASNSQEVIDKVEAVSGIHVDIISGDEEARLVRDCYFAKTPSAPSKILFTDVGGGSTDVCLAIDGEVTYTRSFPVGSMRLICGTMEPDALHVLSDELSRLCDLHGPLHVVGSGGGIHKIGELFPNVNCPTHITCETINHACDELNQLSLEEKMTRYHLKRDRAEIIAEAALIFRTIATATRIPYIETAAIGVRDGIIVNLMKQF